MSADNGIYIAEFPTLDGGREWRVAYGSAIDNLDYYPADSIEEAQEIMSYFGRSEAFTNQDDAFKKAQDIYDTVGWTEYGIRGLTPFEHPFEVYKNRAETEQEIV